MDEENVEQNEPQVTQLNNNETPVEQAETQAEALQDSTPAQPSLETSVDKAENTKSVLGNSDEIASSSRQGGTSRNVKQAQVQAQEQVIFSAPLSTPIANPLKLILQKCKQAIFNKKQKKLEKILELAKKKNKVTNDDVQKLVLVSDKTAERYLAELTGRGKLNKAGSTSQIYYQIIN